MVRCVVGVTSVQGGGGITLHHHPFLFAKVLDRLTDELRQESPLSKVFISTTLICSNSRDDLQQKDSSKREREIYKMGGTPAMMYGVGMVVLTQSLKIEARVKNDTHCERSRWTGQFLFFQLPNATVY